MAVNAVVNSGASTQGQPVAQQSAARVGGSKAGEQKTEAVHGETVKENQPASSSPKNAGHEQYHRGGRKSTTSETGQHLNVKV